MFPPLVKKKITYCIPYLYSCFKLLKVLIYFLNFKISITYILSVNSHKYLVKSSEKNTLIYVDLKKIH